MTDNGHTPRENLAYAIVVLEFYGEIRNYYVRKGGKSAVQEEQGIRAMGILKSFREDVDELSGVLERVKVLEERAREVVRGNAHWDTCFRGETTPCVCPMGALEDALNKETKA